MHKNIPASRHMLVPVIALLLLALVACGSKINEANFNRIETDMTQKQVHGILGAPTESSSIKIGDFSGASSTWTNEEVTISIQFLNGKVKAKEFSKPAK